MLAIVTSHPIQYQAPLWRELAAAGVPFEVWFLTRHAVQASFDSEFGRSFAWDVDLLEGYPHRFLPVADGWQLDRFRGVRLTARWRDEFAARNVTRVWVEGWRFSEFWRAIRAAHAIGLPVWLRGETNDLAPRTGVRGLVRQVALRWLFQRVHRCLCIGSANRRFYRNLGVPEEKCVAAPYCVDNARFAHAADALRPRRAELRARWQIAPEAFVLLFCGKLIAKKRPLDLVAAAQRVRGEATRPLHLLFAGEGELSDPVRKALAEHGLSGSVTGFLNQTEIPAAYGAADCLVLPSDAGETWGLVVNEALASGLDVIVSDLCGCAEDLARPLGSEHVFPCGDVAALGQAIVATQRLPSSLEIRQKTIDAHAPKRTVETVCALLSPSATS